MGVDFTDNRSLGNTNLRDLLRLTQANLEFGGKIEVLQKYHEYPVCSLWFTDDKIEFDSGTSIERNVQVTESGTAHYTSAYTPESPSVTDLTGKLRVEWCKMIDDYSIERSEMLKNRSKPLLKKLVNSRRTSSMENIANLLEESAWVSPNDSSDKLRPYGIPMWITPIVTGLKYGHVGNLPYFADGNAATSCGGIVPNTSDPDSSRWKNYADRWAAAASYDATLTRADITKITRMIRRLKWRSPTFVKDIDNTSYRQMRLYTGEENIEAMADYARGQNDQLGRDIGRYSNSVMINNFPVVWVELLDYKQGVDTTYPLYAINHKYFKPFVMKGDWFRETPDMNSVALHDVFTTFIDLQFNFICTNRQRAGGIISAVVA